MSPSDPTADDVITDAFETLAVHAGAEPDELTGAVSPPIYQTSTYAQDGVNQPRRLLSGGAPAVVAVRGEDPAGVVKKLDLLEYHSHLSRG